MRNLSLRLELLVERFVSRQAPDRVRAAMDRVMDEVDEPVDPFVVAAAERILRRVEW